MWANTKTVPSVGRVILVALSAQEIMNFDLIVERDQLCRADVVYVNHNTQTVRVLLQDHKGAELFLGDEVAEELDVYDLPAGMTLCSPEFGEWTDDLFAALAEHDRVQAVAIWMPYQQKMHENQGKLDAVLGSVQDNGKTPVHIASAPHNLSGAQDNSNPYNQPVSGFSAVVSGINSSLTLTDGKDV